MNSLRKLTLFCLVFLSILCLLPADAANPFDSKNTVEISGSGSASTDGNSKLRVENSRNGKQQDARPCTLAVMADLHAKPESLPLLKKAVDRVNNLKDIMGLAIVGDLCSKLGTRSEYETLKAGLKAAKIPVYAVPGNHDILYKDYLIDGEKKRGTPAEKKAKHELFKKTLNLKSLYYSRKIGGHLLIFLPNDALSAIPCSFPSDDAYDFLRQTLHENRKLPTIVFNHAPLEGSYGDKRTMPPIQANAQPSGKLKRLLQKNPQVYLWFAGHLHITPSQKYFNFPGNRVGKVNVVHVPPSQIHASWVQVVRLSPKGAIIKTLDVKSGKYLKGQTRVFRPNIKIAADADNNNSQPDKNDKNDGKADKIAKKARIVITNAHSGGNRNRAGFGDWLENQEPDIALVSESVDMNPHLRSSGRVFNAGNETRGRREVVVVVRDGLPVMKHDFGKISPDLGSGIAHDRWWTRAQTKVAGIKTRVYSLHLNAVIQEKTGEPRAERRWEVTRDGLSRLEKIWRQDIKDGWAILIGGDLNWNDSRQNARTHKMAPGNIFKRLGLTYVNNELMWLAWNPKAHKSIKRQAIPPTSIPGLFAGEHPALKIDLQARKAPEKPESDVEEEKQKTDEEEAKDEDANEPDSDASELDDTEFDDSVLDSDSDESPIDTPAESSAEPEEDQSPDGSVDSSEAEDLEEIASDNAESDLETEEAVNSPTDDETKSAVDSEAETGIEQESVSETETGSENTSAAVTPEQAAIERIRELVGMLQDFLQGILSAFESLLKS
ncbi:hypothetical protein MASR1M12_14830 [Erysipelotrichia bacterium]